MNKKLSDDTNRILELQGVGWLTRKTISLATITLNIKHYNDDNNVEHIDIDQTLTGGIKGTSENRTLDWTERENSDHVFGPVLSKSRHVSLEEVEDPFLKDGFSSDVKETGIVLSFAKSDTEKSNRTWSVEQTWGFEIVEDIRHYARHVKFSYNNGEEVHEAKLFYDFVS